MFEVSISDLKHGPDNKIVSTTKQWIIRLLH